MDRRTDVMNRALPLAQMLVQIKNNGYANKLLFFLTLFLPVQALFLPKIGPGKKRGVKIVGIEQNRGACFLFQKYLRIAVGNITKFPLI